MKYIFIIALLILTITAKSLHKNQDDAFGQCMAKNCRKQAGSCARTKGCLDNITNCSDQFEKEENFDNFDTCLAKIPQSAALMECVFMNCFGEERKSLAAKKILKSMN
ncbi:unnamed protein product [Paramecium sonneborni]|uniref:Uncharacterized protein n=1 Tax=Paramecium sonneborni TaxID=65129 RepID=A0A8S1QP97_9CILI|nr:unnamed protein product [Paramecium sonneborni]